MIPALQLDDVTARALGKGFVFVVMLFRFAVEPFQVRQRHFARVFLLLFFQVSNQHAELGTPVANVVCADYLVTEKLKRAHRGITNDGGTQVANVHLFRHVRGRVVDHHRLRLWSGDTQTV